MVKKDSEFFYNGKSRAKLYTIGRTLLKLEKLWLKSQYQENILGQNEHEPSFILQNLKIHIFIEF